MSVYLYLSHNLRKILQHTSLGSLSSPFSLRHSPTRTPPFCFSRADPHPCSLLAPLLPCPDPCCSICSVASMQLTFALSESYTHRYSCQPVCLCVCIIFLFFLIFIFLLFCIFACIIQEWVERLWRGWTALLSGLRLSACPASCLLHPFWLAGAVSLLLLIYIYTADYIYRRISMWIFSSQLEFYLALPRSLFVAIFPQIFLTIFFFLYFCIAFLSTAWLPRFWCGICIYKMKDKFFMSHKEFQYL